MNYGFNGIKRATAACIAVGLTLGQAAQEETINGIECVWVEGGTFVMGSPTSEANRDNDETQHQVTLTKSYFIGKYPVTQGQYQAKTGSNP